LLDLVGAVHLPETVRIELERGSTDISDLDVTVEQVEYDDSTYPHLDPGETAALVLCSVRDAVLLTDDLDARTTATEEGIEVHGSVGVVLYAYSHGELADDETKRLLRALQQDTNLYLSTPLVEHAIEMVEADDAGW
jgi:predicted nucleic acid-binding protein